MPPAVSSTLGWITDGLGDDMDFVLAGIAAVFLLIYLAYAMFYPEKF